MIESKLIPKALFSDKSVKSVNNLKDYAGIEYIASMNQTHSDVVTFVKSPALYDSDGIYTEEPKLGLVVQTADCMPILLSDKKRIGAIHSGWRGLKNNIVEKAIKKLYEKYPFLNCKNKKRIKLKIKSIKKVPTKDKKSTKIVRQKIRIVSKKVNCKVTT